MPSRGPSAPSEHERAAAKPAGTERTVAFVAAEQEEELSSTPGPTDVPESPKKTRDMSEVGKKISRALKGRRLSEERKQKISAALRGRKLSEEHKRKLSARFGGKNNPMFGRSLSAETRKKISRAMIASHDLRRLDQSNVGEDEDASLNARKGLKPLPPELLKTVMESRLVSSLGKPGKFRGTDAAIEELLESVATGKVPPSAVRRMREAAERARGETEGAATLKRPGTGKRRGRPPRNAQIDRMVNHTVSIEKSRDPHPAASAPKGAGRERRDRSILGVVSEPSSERGRMADSKVKKQRNGRGMPACGECSGKGLVACPQCVGTTGVASRHCSACMGAATVFCSSCHGSGVLV
jgi:NUMOD3 motif